MQFEDCGFREIIDQGLKVEGIIFNQNKVLIDATLLK